MKKRVSDEEIYRIAKQGVFLNLKQLSIATGFCYSTVHKWRKEGLPLINGKIRLADALAWLRDRPEEVFVRDAGIAEHPLHPNAGKFCVPMPTSG